MKLYKYTMLDEQTDYRPSVEVHRVKLIKRIAGDNNDIAYVYLTDEEASTYDDLTLVEQAEIDANPDILVMQVPEKISRAQALLQLLEDGITASAVQSAIDAIPDELTKAKANIYWNESNEFYRNHPLIGQIGLAIGLTDEELDEMFLNATKL